MTRQWGRAPKGQRVHEATPQGHWQVLTTLGAMSLRGIDAAMTVESATDGDVFGAFLELVLCPKLRPGDVVVMDNLSSHKVEGIREQIEACHAQLLYLPPYSPDLNPIEKAWSKFNNSSVRPKHEAKKPWIKLSPKHSPPSPRKTPPPGSATPGMGYIDLGLALGGWVPRWLRCRFFKQCSRAVDVVADKGTQTDFVGGAVRRPPRRVDASSWRDARCCASCG